MSVGGSAPKLATKATYVWTSASVSATSIVQTCPPPQAVTSLLVVRSKISMFQGVGPTSSVAVAVRVVVNGGAPRAGGLAPRATLSQLTPKSGGAAPMLGPAPTRRTQAR